MRKGAKVKYSKDSSVNFHFSVDWKENPSDVMEAVGKELAQHGLEVVSHESDGDFYAFSIMKIKKKAVKKPKVHPLTTETLK